ncbi:DUF2268 domain-containing putative Zn-dependent protease [Nisaea sp.]|uniref:DUF2268 domain-containing putative Zn-dependent protease n=1 Tax=Nisaea sp. TaxID=2024842 RepID=UPI00326461CB
MNWHVHYLDGHGRISPFKAAVEKALDDVKARMLAVCELPQVDIVVRAVPADWVIPEKGHVGRCSGEIVDLYLAPEHPNLTGNLGQSLSQMIAHEMHHAMRFQSIGLPKTLGDVLVSEGLAGRFVEELFQNDPEPWERAFSRLELQKFVPLAQTSFDGSDYDYAEWTYGTGKLPRWLGYTLGYEIVGDFIARNSGACASNLVSAPSADFKMALDSFAA